MTRLSAAFDQIQLAHTKIRNPGTKAQRSRLSCRRTYRVLSHVTGAPRLVLEDLDQDVWLSALESIECFDATRGTAQDWIFGIARFQGLNYLRKNYSSRLAYVGDCSVLHEQPELPASAVALKGQLNWSC